MNLTWFTISAAAIGFLILDLAGSAQGYIDGPKEPAPARFALADCVVLGKITDVKDKPVTAGTYGGRLREKQFKIAQLQITERIHGARDLKQVQVGFLGYDPKVGDQGCFCVIKHPDQDFYVVPGPGNCFLDAKSSDYDKELALLRRCAKVMEDADASLKGDNVRDRMLTAYLLIYRDNYAPVRKPTPGLKLKAEPLEAEQSKLLLRAIAAADWSATDPETKASPPDLLRLISYCRPYAGLSSPATFPKFGEPMTAANEAAAKKWLHDNAESYRLQKLVRGK